mgnify:CR=1 FL=1
MTNNRYLWDIECRRAVVWKEVPDLLLIVEGGGSPMWLEIGIQPEGRRHYPAVRLIAAHLRNLRL